MLLFYSIEDLILNDISLFQQIDEPMEYNIKKMCKEMKSMALSPFNLFTMNFSTLVSVIATVLTYVIVLLQLKTVELPLKA